MTTENKLIISGAVIISIAILILAVINNGNKVTIPGQYDNFAQCLAEKGATMYGAEWCPHCKDQKAAFGDSFKYIKYVECPDNIKLCIDKGVQGYPTWLFTGTTTQVEGFEGNKTMQELAKVTGCQLSQ
jgi:hypothetical protein